MGLLPVPGRFAKTRSSWRVGSSWRNAACSMQLASLPQREIHTLLAETAALALKRLLGFQSQLAGFFP